MTDHETQHSSRRDRPFRRHALGAARALALLFVLALLVHLSWNMFAPDMLGLAPIRVKQALGLVVFAAVFGLLLGGGRRGAWRLTGLHGK